MTTENERALETTVELEAVNVPPVNVYLNLDVIDYLQSHTEAELFELIGKLKDLIT
jgi:hypothetical protein